VDGAHLNNIISTRDIKAHIADSASSIALKLADYINVIFVVF